MIEKLKDDVTLSIICLLDAYASYPAAEGDSVYTPRGVYPDSSNSFSQSQAYALTASVISLPLW